MNHFSGKLLGAFVFFLFTFLGVSLYGACWSFKESEGDDTCPYVGTFLPSLSTEEPRPEVGLSSSYDVQAFEWGELEEEQILYTGAGQKGRLKEPRETSHGLVLSCDIFSIPAEVWYPTFLWLDWKDILSVMATCQRLKEIARDPSFLAQVPNFDPYQLRLKPWVGGPPVNTFENYVFNRVMRRSMTSLLCMKKHWDTMLRCIRQNAMTSVHTNLLLVIGTPVSKAICFLETVSYASPTPIVEIKKFLISAYIGITMVKSLDVSINDNVIARCGVPGQNKSERELMNLYMLLTKGYKPLTSFYYDSPSSGDPISTLHSFWLADEVRQEWDFEWVRSGKGG